MRYLFNAAWLTILLIGYSFGQDSLIQAIVPVSDGVILDAITPEPITKRLVYVRSDWCTNCEPASNEVEALIDNGWGDYIETIDYEECSQRGYRVNSVPSFIRVEGTANTIHTGYLNRWAIADFYEGSCYKP